MSPESNQLITKRGLLKGTVYLFAGLSGSAIHIERTPDPVKESPFQAENKLYLLEEEIMSEIPSDTESDTPSGVESKEFSVGTRKYTLSVNRIDPSPATNNHLRTLIINDESLNLIYHLEYGANLYQEESMQVFTKVDTEGVKVITNELEENFNIWKEQATQYDPGN